MWQISHPSGNGTSLESYFKAIKTGLQPVSIPTEQVPLLKGLGWVQSPFGALCCCCCLGEALGNIQLLQSSLFTS